MLPAWFSRSVTALVLAAIFAFQASASATTCALASEMDPGSRSALEKAADQLLQMAAAGNVAGLRSAALPSLASSFSGIENAVMQNQNSLKAGKAESLGVYLLGAEGTATLPRAEFFCGVFNSPDRVSFVIPNLPPGQYGIVSYATKGESPVYFTPILSEQGGAWKLAGLTITPREINGHDAAYYASKAAEYAASNQNLLAWLFYMQAWQLKAPVNFMYTAERDKLADAIQKARPADFPSQQSPMQVSAGGKTYAVTDIFAEPVQMEGSSDLYLILKYRALTDVSDTGKTFQANVDAIHAFVQRFPGIRGAFDGVVARAVDSSGTDYGTMLSMKDVAQ